MTVPDPLIRPISFSDLRIFVSYHHKDSGFGAKLVQDIRTMLSDDTAIWYTIDDGQGTADLWSRVVGELSTRNVYIFVLSPDAVSSSWVLKEMSIALGQTVPNARRLIPVIYRQCKIPQDYDIYQNVSFNNKPYAVAFNELLLILAGLPVKKVGTILSMRLLLLLFIILFLISLSLGFAASRLMPNLQPPKATPTAQVTASVVPPNKTPISTPAPQPTIPGTVPPSVVTTTPLPNLYPNPPGIFIGDPLVNNNCQISQGVYHISVTGQLGQLGQFNIKSCYSSPSVTNFVYELQVTIVKGDFGGIFFRYQPPPSSTDPQRYYDFLVSSGGMYQLIITGVSPTFLAKGYSPFINKGLNVQNTLAVVASGSHIDLYVNQHIVASLKDSTLSKGYCGVSALGVNNQTEVTFTNLKVWTL